MFVVNCEYAIPDHQQAIAVFNSVRSPRLSYGINSTLGASPPQKQYYLHRKSLKPSSLPLLPLDAQIHSSHATYQYNRSRQQLLFLPFKSTHPGKTKYTCVFFRLVYPLGSSCASAITREANCLIVRTTKKHKQIPAHIPVTSKCFLDTVQSPKTLTSVP